MDFTREPIIESVITPKEGCKLVVRSSKGAGQEEFFVDAVEIVSFGGTFFLRSLEKPKAFLVPSTDYEILEVRETRMVLKNVGMDRSIKIAGGRGEGVKRPQKEVLKPQVIEPEQKPEVKEPAEVKEKPEPKKRERRRHYRKRRGAEPVSGQESQPVEKTEEESAPKRVRIPVPETFVNLEKEGIGKPFTPSTTVLSSLLPPPPTLISESIERYKGNELFKNVFIPKGELAERKKPVEEEKHDFPDEPTVELEVPFSQDLYLRDDIFDIAVETEPAEDVSSAEEPISTSDPMIETEKNQ